MINNDLAKVAKKEKQLKNKKKNIPKEILDKRVAEYQLYYMNNLDKFVVDILRIDGLKEFQLNFLTEFTRYDQFDVFGSRRFSKSFLSSLSALSLMCLLPNLRVLCVAGTITQANKIIKEKLDEQFTSLTSKKFNSPTLVELRKRGWIKFSANKDTGGLTCTLGNGSVMYSVVNGESARSNYNRTIVLYN